MYERQRVHLTISPTLMELLSVVASSERNILKAVFIVRDWASSPSIHPHFTLRNREVGAVSGLEECCHMYDALHCLNNRNNELGVYLFWLGFLFSLELNALEQIKLKNSVTHQQCRMSKAGGYKQETLLQVL